ncbi:hypothetical protein ACJJIE_11875 [Microbulbifer sp. TRSA001]|uniref:hypothetical protein n=1 Tax=Microbulbifer sp. TRSA001 TaxID=3243381 RepID=UPI00403A51BF
MAIWIRKVVGQKSKNYLKLAKDDWNLISQFEAFESWLKTDAEDLDPNHEWIADIGFCPRDSASGGGPVITQEIMEICLSRRITIFLSEYGGDDA